MQGIMPNAVVLPSFSEFGIVSKDDRGIVRNQGAMPETLKPLQGALSRIANKLGVDLNQSRDVLKASFEQAVTNRDVEKSAPASIATPSLGNP